MEGVGRGWKGLEEVGSGVSLGREKVLSPACDLNDFLHPQGHEAVDEKSSPFPGPYLVSCFGVLPAREYFAKRADVSIHANGAENVREPTEKPPFALGFPNARSTPVDAPFLWWAPLGFVR